jgi:transposase
VFRLGYWRRLFTRGYRNERLATLLDGHERAFRHFGVSDDLPPLISALEKALEG